MTDARLSSRLIGPNCSAATEIIQYAQEQEVDLIAISTHGRSGFSRLVFGSVAEKVVRQAGIPVLLIKSGRDKEGAGEESGSESPTP